MFGVALIAAGTVVYVAVPRNGATPPAPTASATTSVQTVAQPLPEPLLAELDTAFTEGDLDHASELAERLAVTAEKDPRVLVRRARVAVVKADRVWLASRLVSAVVSSQVVSDGTDASSPEPNAGDDLVTMLLARELGTLGQQAQTLSESALAAAPDDTYAVLARIDALRIAGKLGDADALGFDRTRGRSRWWRCLRSDGCRLRGRRALARGEGRWRPARGPGNRRSAWPGSARREARYLHLSRCEGNVGKRDRFFDAARRGRLVPGVLCSICSRHVLRVVVLHREVRGSAARQAEA
jgi:hypothetical protein